MSDRVFTHPMIRLKDVCIHIPVYLELNYLECTVANCFYYWVLSKEANGQNLDHF